MDTTTSSPTASLIASSPNRYRGLGVVLAIGATVWLTTFGAGIAQADTPPQVEAKTLEVSYDDLNIGSQSGARTLLVRIEKAARNACGPITHSPLLPRERAYQRECVVDAVDAAVKRVDLPTLTALHTGAPADIAIAAR